MSTGKLYQSSDDQLIGDVNYLFQHQSPGRWWGELTLIDYVRIKDGSGYILEIEDGRKSKISIKKKVNKAVSSLPPRYVYHFSGSGTFE